MDEMPTNSEQIVAYALGELDAAEARKLESLLKSDPALAKLSEEIRQAVASLTGAKQDAADWEVTEAQKVALKKIFSPCESGWLQATADRMHEWIARRVRTITPGTPGLAGFRSGAVAHHLVFECDDVEIDIGLRPASGETSPPAASLLGMVTADEMPQRIFALRLSDRVETELPFNEQGNFTGQLEAGDYELHLAFGDRTVVVPRIEIQFEPK